MQFLIVEDVLMGTSGCDVPYDGVKILQKHNLRKTKKAAGLCFFTNGCLGFKLATVFYFADNVQ